VLRCQSGDAGAFDELAERWQERLWRHALRLTGDSEAAWDILQDTWLAISRKIGQLNEAAAFPGWAYRIASNQCRDWQRRERRRRNGIESYAEWFRKVEIQEADSTRCGEVREAVASLADPDQTIINLRYSEGFSVDEIAQILGIPTGTVKSRLHTVRKRLRSQMEESGNE
jgi:RNA polymerase sigma-70 factor (ECF subfamily)